MRPQHGKCTSNAETGPGAAPPAQRHACKAAAVAFKEQSPPVLQSAAFWTARTCGVAGEAAGTGRKADCLTGVEGSEPAAAAAAATAPTSCDAVRCTGDSGPSRGDMGTDPVLVGVPGGLPGGGGGGCVGGGGGAAPAA